MASGIRGVASVRRLMRRMPDAVQTEIVGELHVAGRSLVPAMRARAPSRRGKLRAGISYKVFPKTLRLQVGMLGTRAGRSKLFYARILDLGRKARSVRASRRTAGGGVSTYTMNVRAIRAMHFVTGFYRDLRARLRVNLKRIWDRALARVAGGGG